MLPASPIPVALFFSSFVPGGTENQMIELAVRLDRRRFQVHVVCFHRAGPWLSRVEREVASVAEFPISSFRHPNTITAMRAFARWCRETGIAVLHATDIYANIFGLPAAAAAGVAVRIANRREINPDKSAAMIGLQRASYAFAHCVVANSDAAASRLRRERVRGERITVIANGIDLDRFTTRAPRSQLRRVITVANLRREKGHDVLIDATVVLLRRHPDLEFRIVGGGPRRAELSALADARGVAGRVQFLGHRDDVPALLAESDLFVLPSRSEACPNAVIEAMAAGLPVVATGVGGILELIRDGTTGVLVPPDDRDALTSAVQSLIDDPSRAAALARAGRQTVVARFSFERMVSAFEALYLNELQQRTPLTRRATQLTAS
jgi:glycosyltransferase involved in cell wall biosynthesis